MGTNINIIMRWHLLSAHQLDHQQKQQEDQ